MTFRDGYWMNGETSFNLDILPGGLYLLCIVSNDVYMRKRIGKF
jgi:hypothetical protein